MNDFVELRQFLVIFLNRWPIILLGAVLGAALAFGISQQLSPVYESTTSLLVGQPIQAANVDSRDIQTSEKLALTYSEIGRRQPVLQATVETLDLDMTWQQLRRRVRFSPVEGTQLLDVTVESGSAAEAQVTADEIARQLILLSSAPLQNGEAEGTVEFVRERIESLRQRIESGQARIAELESDAATAETVDEMRSIQNDIDTLEGLITEWESSYAQLLTLVEGEQATNYLEVVDPAHVNPNPVWPKVKLNTVMGGMVGLVLAMGLVLWRHYWDETVQSTGDLRHVLGLTPLGAVAQIKGKRHQDKLITSLKPFSPTSEAYRIIRSNIRFMSEEKPCKVILVTSATFGEGKSLTVANLGIAMAQAGLETIIVDADLRRPAQHKVFEIENETGLTELIRSEELEFDDRFNGTGVDSLHLLSSGTIPPNPSELLASGYTELLLEGLAELADVVIVDGPPLLRVADAAVLSNQVDGVVLVIEAGRTGRGLVRQTISVLQQAGANLLGAVLNRASPKTDGGYYHYYPAAVEDSTGEATRDRWWRPPFLKKAPAETTRKAATNGRYSTEAMADNEDSPSAD